MRRYQMKWERGRRVMAILLSLVLVLSSTGVTAFAEEIPVANAGQAEEVFFDDGQQDTSSEVIDEEALFEDDLLTDGSEDQNTRDESAVSFEQREAVDGAVVTVTADPGVFDADAFLNIIKTDSEDFRQASEADLAIEASDALLIRHAIYSFSRVVMNGDARVELAYLDLSGLQQQYPEGEISVAVLRYKDAEQQLQDRAETLFSEYDIYGDTVSFSMPAPGLYDVVTMIRLPEPEELLADQEIEEAGLEGITEEAAETSAEAVSEQEAEAAEVVETSAEAVSEQEAEAAEVVETSAEAVSEQEAEVAEVVETSAEDVSGQEETDGEIFETSTEATTEQEEITEGNRVQEPSEEFTGDALAEEESDEAEQVSFDQSMTVDGVVITVKAEPGVFPADAVLSVEQVPVNQQAEADAAVEEVRGEDQNVAVSYTFDIKVVNPETGEEYQPADGQTVGVSFALAEVADENLTTNVYHVTEEETTGELTAEALDVTTEITPETGEGTTVTVETDGFSLYTVEFTYNTLEYVMQGDTTVVLSEILQEVGLTGEVTDVAVSNADLFSASNETGEWIVTAHQAFDTTEWMTVTIGGVTYEITVTDDGEITTWNELQTALNAGGTVTLTQGITAGANDSALSVSSGLTVVLDLNGYTIDRGLANSEAQAKGNVITNDGTLTISDTSAAQTGAITGGSNTGSGGAIVNLGKLTVSGGTINGNSAREAGAVFNQSGSELEITGGALKYNSADTYGGGAIVNHGTISLSGGAVQNNTAAMNGGAIWSDGTLTITDGSIANNTAQQNGGAVYITGAESTAAISGGTISGNKAVLSGGAVYTAGGTTTISGGTINGNRANGSHGGAIYVAGDATTLNLFGGTITGNTATGQGGAILKYQDQNTVNIQGNPVITNNQAERGSNIYMRNGTTTTLLTVTGALGADAQIGVTLEAGEGIVTDFFGIYNGPDRLACFVPDSQDYLAGVSSAQEVILGEPVTVSFFAGSGSGTMDSITIARGSEYTLPECGFTPPANGQSFICWNMNGNEKQPGNMVLIEADTTVVAVFNANDVYYIERSWNGKKVVETPDVCTDYELLHSTNSSWYTIGREGETTWYVAQGNITMNGTTLTVRGNVNIILCDGANVQIKDGIEVKTGYSLTIYGQSGDSGRLDSRNNDGDAGIGCGPNSGVGDITIHGGVIEAHGGKYAAGIGSGDERQMGSHITIYGGDIKAYGGAYGAGIGSGDQTGGDNGYIDIYGGIIYAKGGTDGAGIGGGNEGNSRNITIWGGDVTAISSTNEASGIGGGDDGGGGKITINGGVVYAKASDEGPGIGGDSNCGTIVINGGKVTAESKHGAGIGGAMGENLVKGSITINGGVVTASCLEDIDGYGSTGIGAGGSDNDSTGGDLRIPITINGGTVKATGIKSSAGIGSGYNGNVTGQITITGGYVEAVAKDSGAGIGSGGEGNLGIGGEVDKKIIISGGTVIASSGRALAIGHGRDGADKGAELYADAKVTAGSSAEEATVQTADNRAYGMTRKYAKIEPCEHTEFTYTVIDDTKHKKICVACDHEEEEAHSDTDCVCGYHNPIRTVTLASLEGFNVYEVHEDTYFSLPFQEGQIITDGNGSCLRVTGWQRSGDETGAVYAPGSSILVQEDMSFSAVGNPVYGISFAESQNGSISTDQTIGDLTGAAAGETVSLDVKPYNGYRVKSVKYTVCSGDDPLLNPDTNQPVEDEIPLTNGEYRFVMPDVSEIDFLANTLLISAEFEEIPSYQITCDDYTNGTISTDDVTGAYEGEIVRVYVKGNKGYEVSGVFVNSTRIEPSENGNYYFTMPTEDVTLTADFTPVEYQITYELNGGKNSDNNPEKYTVESETITLAAPTREDYEFLGWYDDEFFKNDVVTVIEQGSTGELTLFARWKEHVSDWSLLQAEIDSAADDTLITLMQDYYAEQNDVALTIREGKKLIIDLNGHTLNADGNAIRIFEIQNGDLTIKDSSSAGDGKITGGNAGNSVGGAIIVRAGGTLTLNGGQITNCSASNGGAIALTAASSLFTMNSGTISYNSATHGGGVHVQQGTFVMNGGSIKNNSAAEDGGGLYATQDADITVTGGRIEQNTAEKGNVYLNSVGMKVSGDLYIESVYLTDPLITVTGSLSENSKIGLTYSNNDANNGKTLTSGLNGNGTLEHFFSAKNGYLTGLNPDGEIVMGKPVTVSFDSNGGSEVESQTIAKNSIAATPTDPTYDGHTFKGWYQVTDADAGNLAETEFDFENTVITENVTLKAVWEEMTAPEFKTQSLLLSGKIGVVFYMDLPGINGVDYSTSKMTFTIPHGTCTSEALYNPDFRNSAGKYYGFICYVNSIQMAEKITATFHYTENSEEKTVERTFAAADYFDSFDKCVEDDTITDEKMIQLVHAVADFGHYIQPFLSAARNWTIGADYEEMKKYYTDSAAYNIDVIRNAVSDKAIKVEGMDSNSDIVEIRHSLTLDSDTVINVYFKPAEDYRGTFTASIDSGTAQTYTPGTDGRYCVQISGIAAHALSEDHTIEVITTTGRLDITVSALSYVNSALTYYNDDNDAQNTARNAVSAVHAYSETADAYKEAHPTN